MAKTQQELAKEWWTAFRFKTEFTPRELYHPEGIIKIRGSGLVTVGGTPIACVGQGRYQKDRSIVLYTRTLKVHFKNALMSARWQINSNATPVIYVWSPVLVVGDPLTRSGKVKKEVSEEIKRYLRAGMSELKEAGKQGVFNAWHQLKYRIRAVDEYFGKFGYTSRVVRPAFVNEAEGLLDIERPRYEVAAARKEFLGERSVYKSYLDRVREGQTPQIYWVSKVDLGITGTDKLTLDQWKEWAEACGYEEKRPGKLK